MHTLHLIVAAVVGSAAAASMTTCVSSVLAHPTPITPYRNGVATRTFKVGHVQLYDKRCKRIEMPFKLGIYESEGGTDFRHDVGICNDGLIFTGPASDPGYEIEWNVFYYPNYTITKGLNQGVFYSIEGKAPHRTANFEWRLGQSKSKPPTETWHFGLQFYEDDNKVARFKYWHIPKPHFPTDQYCEYGYGCNPVELYFYRGYLEDGVPKYVISGDVLIYNGSGTDAPFKRGPRSACKYEGPSNEH